VRLSPLLRSVLLQLLPFPPPALWDCPFRNWGILDRASLLARAENRAGR